MGAVNQTEYCYVDEVDREECGYPGMSGVQCHAKGCCWRPSENEGVPWCFGRSSTSRWTTATTTTLTTPEQPMIVRDSHKTTEDTTTVRVVLKKDPALDDFLMYTAPGVVQSKITEPAVYDKLVQRCQGWLSKEFLTIEYLNQYPDRHRQATQKVFLEQCFGKDVTAIRKGERYFKGKGGWNGNDCKWQEIWQKSGLQVPVQ